MYTGLVIRVKAAPAKIDVGDFLEVLLKEEPGQAVEEEEVGALVQKGGTPYSSMAYTST
jgi:hypothetical protein